MASSLCWSPSPMLPLQVKFVMSLRFSCRQTLGRRKGLLAASLFLILLASLAKEIGITIVRAFAAFVRPWTRKNLQGFLPSTYSQRLKACKVESQLELLGSWHDPGSLSSSSTFAFPFSQVGAMIAFDAWLCPLPSNPCSIQAQRRRTDPQSSKQSKPTDSPECLMGSWLQWVAFKWLALIIISASYVALRSWLAVDQIVSIYRKVSSLWLHRDPHKLTKWLKQKRHTRLHMQIKSQGRFLPQTSIPFE